MAHGTFQFRDDVSTIMVMSTIQWKENHEKNVWWQICWYCGSLFSCSINIHFFFTTHWNIANKKMKHCFTIQSYWPPTETVIGYTCRNFIMDASCHMTFDILKIPVVDYRHGFKSFLECCSIMTFKELENQACLHLKSATLIIWYMNIKQSTALYDLVVSSHLFGSLSLLYKYDSVKKRKSTTDNFCLKV